MDANKICTCVMAFALIIFMQGCSANPSPSSTLFQTASASDLPTWVPMSSAEAKAAYKKVAQASCLAAQNNGEVDQNQSIRKVMVAKALAYKDAAIDVTFDSTDGSFTAKQDLGDLGVSTWKYGVAGGLISSALDVTDAKATEYKVSYGVPDPASLEVLRTAVDNYLASIN